MGSANDLLEDRKPHPATVGPADNPHENRAGYLILFVTRCGIRAGLYHSANVSNPSGIRNSRRDFKSDRRDSWHRAEKELCNLHRSGFFPSHFEGCFEVIVPSAFEPTRVPICFPARNQKVPVRGSQQGAIHRHEAAKFSLITAELFDQGIEGSPGSSEVCRGATQQAELRMYTPPGMATESRSPHILSDEGVRHCQVDGLVEKIQE